MLFSLLCFIFVASSCAMVDVTDRLKGRVVHFESLRIRGEWSYTSSYYDHLSYSHFMKVDPYLERDVAYVPRIQFRAFVCAGKYLCFESMELVGRFMMAGYTTETGARTCLIREDAYPEGQIGNHWIVKCETEEMLKCTLTSRRWESEPLGMIHQWRQIDDHERDGDYYTTLGNPNEEKLKDLQYWRIFAPNPSDQMVQILDITNDIDEMQAYTRQITLGVTTSETTTESFHTSTSVEIGGAFKAFSASASTTISTSWQTESSTTYESSISTTIIVNVPAYTRVLVYQLKGEYMDQFGVHSETYEMVGTSSKSGEKMKRVVRGKIQKPGRIPVLDFIKEFGTKVEL